MILSFLFLSGFVCLFRFAVLSILLEKACFIMAFYIDMSFVFVNFIDV